MKLPTEINASSMADVAFLLLIFFLVTTTIDQDKGLTVRLPPMEFIEQNPQPIHKRNLIEIFINQDDALLVNDKDMKIEELSTFITSFVQNKEKLKTRPKTPKHAVISLQCDKQTSYNKYVEVHDVIKSAYHKMWDAQAQIMYQADYDALGSNDLRKSVRTAYPYKISEAEPF